MSNIIAYFGETIPLHSFVVGKDGALKDQVAPWPKITIKKIESGIFSTIVDEETMTEDINGEYFYEWAVPEVAASYKAFYEGRINGIPVYGWDTIQVRDNNLIVYSVEGAEADRFNVVVDTPFTLQAQIYKNGAAFAPFSVPRVEIYDSREEAEKAYGVGIPIETITAGNISGAGVGKFEYMPTVLSTANIYYDKVYFVPNSGDLEQDGLLPFYVRKVSVGITPPAPIETADIELHLYDLVATAKRGDIVTVTANIRQAWYNNEFITLADKQEFSADSDGIVTLTLTETTTLGADVHYIVDVAGVLKERIKVPIGTLSANYKDLPRV